MMLQRAVLGLSLALLVACAKTDEPRAPAPSASSVGAGTSNLATADVGDVSEERDAAGVLRALPMPQQYPHVTLDAAAWDAGAKHR